MTTNQPEHVGTIAGADCPICGPLLTAARKASDQWTREQRRWPIDRNSAEYRNAAAANRAAASALLAAKRDHYQVATCPHAVNSDCPHYS